MKRILFTFFSFLILQLFCVSGAVAGVKLDIIEPGQRILNVAMADPLSSGGGSASSLGNELHGLINDNLSFLPFLRIIPSGGIMGGSKLYGFKSPDVDFNRFKMAGADLLITSGWVNGDTVELRVYEPVTGQLVFGKSYSDINSKLAPKVADRFCSEFMKALTGRGEFFLSTLAFIKDNGQNRQLWTVRPTGRELSQVTNMQGIALSPAWSPDGRYLFHGTLQPRQGIPPLLALLVTRPMAKNGRRLQLVPGAGVGCGSRLGAGRRGLRALAATADDGRLFYR